MSTARFTKQTVEKLIATKADELIFDEACQGFGLRTYASGAPAVWFVKYSAGGVQRRMVLGAARWSNLDQMRDLAELTRAKAKLGTDTLAEQRAAREAPRSKRLGELIEPYLKARADELRERSLYISRMYLEKHWRMLHRRPLDSLTRRDIVPLIDAFKEERGAVTADRCKTVLSSFFAWAVDRNYAEVNPCADIDSRAPSGSRERVLTFDELVAVWKATDDGSSFGKVVRLLLLTGARKMEIIGLLWPEVNLAERQLELPAERVKINKPFLICLAEPGLAILKTVPVVVDRPRLFVGFSSSRYMDDLRALLPGMPHWTLHDLRRSFATHANELGLAPPHIIDSALGHLVGNKVSQTYKALYLGERRQLAAAWARHVEGLVAGKRKGKARA
jgi:integrase